MEILNFIMQPAGTLKDLRRKAQRIMFLCHSKISCTWQSCAAGLEIPDRVQDGHTQFAQFEQEC